MPLLPELAGIAPADLPSNVSPAQERRLLRDAVIRFLSNAAGPAGTLLVLDDLHCAGPEALDLLLRLLLAEGNAHFRLWGAYRDSEAGARAPLAGLLANLAKEELAIHVPLERLLPEEARCLLAGLLRHQADLAPALYDMILRQADGVPFFLVSYARSLADTQGQQHVMESVPWPIVLSIRQRVAALPHVAQEVIGTAAVVGLHVPRDLLVTIAARGEDEVLDALDTACRAGLLVSGGNDAYRFAHDVIRDVVAGDVGAARRVPVLRRLAELHVTESAAG